MIYQTFLIFLSYCQFTTNLAFQHNVTMCVCVGGVRITSSYQKTMQRHLNKIQKILIYSQLHVKNRNIGRPGMEKGEEQPYSSWCTCWYIQTSCFISKYWKSKMPQNLQEVWQNPSPESQRKNKIWSVIAAISLTNSIAWTNCRCVCKSGWFEIS